MFISARDLPVRAGCYAEYIAVPARAAHPLPSGVDLEAASCLSNYQVAYHLLHTAARGVEARTVLVHTAAGGVGSAAVQLALIAGMRVIGVAGSEAKRQAVLRLGATHAFNHRTDDIVARVREATSGRGRRPDPRPDRRQGLRPQFRDAGAARAGDLVWPPRRPARPRLRAGHARAPRGQPGGSLLHHPQLRSPARHSRSGDNTRCSTISPPAASVR